MMLLITSRSWWGQWKLNDIPVAWKVTWFSHVHRQSLCLIYIKTTIYKAGKIIAKAVTSLSYLEPKIEQQKTVLYIVVGADVFVCLITRKSYIQLLAQKS